MKTIKIPFILNFIRKYEFPKKLGLLEFLYGKKLSHHGNAWVECSNGIPWKLNLEDVCHRWIVYGKYEGGGGIDLARRHLDRGGVYVDSGANIGQWLLYIASQKNIKTIAFEPVESERSWLTKCVEAQEDWNMSILPFGLGSEKGQLHIQKNGPRSTLNLDWYQNENHALEKIEIRRIENVLDELLVDKVTFWKLDVEGAELDALKGAEKYLREKRIEIIYFECHPDNYQSIRNFFRLYDYDVYNLVSGELISKQEDRILETQDLVATHNSEFVK